MEEKTNKKKLLIIFTAFILLALAGLGANYFFAGKTLSLSGKVLDGDSGKAIGSGVTISYHGKIYTPDKEGAFSIDDYQPYSDTMLEVRDQQLFSPLKVDAGVKRYIEISINRGSEVILNKFFHDMTNALYRQNYALIDPSIKSKINEDAFLRAANDYSLSYKKQGWEIINVGYAVLESSNYFSPVANKTYDKALAVLASFEMKKGNESKVVKKRTNFYKADNAWVWLYGSDFFKEE